MGKTKISACIHGKLINQKCDDCISFLIEQAEKETAEATLKTANIEKEKAVLEARKTAFSEVFKELELYLDIFFIRYESEKCSKCDDKNCDLWKGFYEIKKKFGVDEVII